MYDKKMMAGGMVKAMAGGGMAERKAKRPNPYTGNEPEANAVEKETSSEKFAEGGMAGKKGAVLAIVAKLARKPKEMSEGMQKEAEMEEAEEDGGSMKEAKMAAAEEVMGALKSGDKSAFADALETFMRACS